MAAANIIGWAAVNKVLRLAAANIVLRLTAAAAQPTLGFKLAAANTPSAFWLPNADYSR